MRTSVAMTVGKPVILIVDDHARNRDSLKSTLEGAGFTVQDAANGAEALAKARVSPPDLIISDLLMPVMDGYTLLRQLKADENLFDIPLIVYSGTYTDRKDKQLALDLGADSFVLKPARLSEITARIDAALERKLRGLRERGPALIDVNESNLLHEYSQTLGHKLEKKLLQVERFNRALQHSMAQQKQAEQIAIRERDFSDGILDALPGVLFMYDGNLGIRRWNRNFEQVSGYSGPEIASMSPLDFFRGPDREQVEKRIGDVFARGSAEVEADVVAKDGTCTPHYLTGHRTHFDGRDFLLGIGIDISARRQAEQELRASESRFRRLFEQASDGIFIFSADHRFLDANDRGLEMLRCSREEILRLGVADFVVPEQRHRLMKEPVEIAPGQTYLAEWTQLRKDGSTFPAEVSARQLNDESFLAIVRDLTERRRAEAALREREEQLRLFVEHSPAAIAMLDRDMRYVVASHRFLSDYELPDRDIVGCNHYELFPELPERWLQIHQRCLAGAIEKCDRDQFVRSDGRIDWVRWEIQPWRKATGEIGGIIILTEVITRQVHAEEAVFASNERLRLAMDAAHMGMFDWDMNAGKITWSSRHEELFGFAPGEFDGTYAAFERHLHPDDIAGINAEIAQCIATRKQLEREFRVVWPDGSVHWVEARGEFAYGPEGRPLHMHGVVLETTERRQAEEGLRLFRTLIDQSNDAIEVIDPATGRFLDVNEKACRELGYGRDELLTLRVSDIDPTVSESSWDGIMEKLRETKTMVTEGLHRRKDGTTLAVEISAKWVHVGRDYALAVVRDITERKRAEGELRESERRFRSLLSNMDLVSIMLDTQARITYCNDFLLQITGWQREELLGRDWFEVFIPKDAEDGRKVFSALISDLPAAWHHEQHILTRSGERRLIRWNNTVLRSVSGEVIGTASIGADISDQRQAEISLRRLNRIYAVLSGINSLIVRERNRQHLFDEACRIAVEDGHFELAWIGTVDNIAPSIDPVARRGSEADLKLIAGVNFTPILKKPGGKGTVVEAVRSLKPVYRNDLTLEQDAHPKLRKMCDRGYRSVISLPLLVQGACAAVMVLYSKEAGFFDHDELKLLSELAGDLSFALEYMEQEEKVNFLAFHDPLTGLANRTRLHARLTDALETAGRQSQSCALVLMNLNNFHHINNTLGHQNGDLLLQQVARSVRESVWDSDLVACLGGDEFAILLPRLASSEDIELVVRKISTSLRSTFTVAGLPISLEARIGYAIYPDQADNPDLLWQRAGVALRAAKELHLPQLMYDRSSDHYDPQHLALVSGFQNAIDADELVLHYQPKIDLQHQHVIGVEALLRWQHPVSGLLYPDAFIPLVESTGLVNPMTTWVLANAMRQARIWERAGVRLRIAVNLSVRNLQNPALLQEITDLARSSRFPLERLTLEITESAVMVNPEQGKSVLTRLHDAGIRFSMDDFGIGHSSLSYLKDLPITQLKIDKSFVMGFSEPRNAAIVRAALEMGHSLGMQVTAEGIEDETTFKALRDIGCDTGQGYFFSKPLPPDKLMTWLRTSNWKLAEN